MPDYRKALEEAERAAGIYESLASAKEALQALADLDGSRAALESEIANMEAAKGSLHDQVVEQSDKVRALKAEEQAIRDRLGDVKKTVETETKKLNDQLSTQRQRVGEEMNKLSAELASLQGEASTARLELDELNARVAERRATLEKLVSA